MMSKLFNALYILLKPLRECFIFISLLFFKIFPTKAARNISYKEFKELSYQKVNKSFFLSYLEIILASKVENIILIIPYPVFFVILNLIAIPLYLVFYPYHRIVHINLEIVFNSNAYKEFQKKIHLYPQNTKKIIPKYIKSIRLKNYFSTIVNIGEVARFKALTEKKLYRDTTVHNLEAVEEAYKQNKGVLLFSAHYGNFLYPMIYLAQVKKMKLNFIIRRMDNPFIGFITYNFFSDIGINTIIRSTSAIKATLEALKRGEIVYLLMDQNVAVGGTFVPFFDRPASTFRGIYQFQEKTGCAVIGCHDHRDFLAKHSLTFYDPIPKQKSEDDLVLKINQQIEEFLVEDPIQHMWIHPRWKRQPPNVESPYQSVKNIASK